MRVPRRQIAAELIVNEQRWLPVLAPHLPIAVPSPVRLGQPGDHYPWPWSIVPWLPGAPADIEPPLSSEAQRLADFLTALHLTAPPDAPLNPVRGVPLRDRASSFADRLDRVRSRLAAQIESVIHLWQLTLDTEIDVDPRWLHGDPHPQNILVEDGTICAVIDWGDVTSGDPANDLAAIWMLFADPAARARAISRYNPTPQTLRRAVGWAVFFGVILLDVGTADNPRHAKVGQATLDRVIADARDTINF